MTAQQMIIHDFHGARIRQRPCDGYLDATDYPPYHSKYNPIERCWGALENYWNGAILDTIDSAINWAVNMSFKGKNPDVYLVEGTYKKSVVVGKKELKSFKPFWKRSEELPKWDVTILPVSA